MRLYRTPGIFDPHETQRSHALAGRQLAGFRRRAGALIVDFLILAVFWIPFRVGSDYFIHQKLHLNEEIYKSSTGKTEVKFEFERTMELAWTVFLILYFGLSFRVTNGYTVGKRLMRIRVLSLTHEQMGIWQSIERALGYAASALEGGLGFYQY
ncbi:MAG: RDD family protein, partial [Terriglobales bacterium]